MTDPDGYKLNPLEPNDYHSFNHFIRAASLLRSTVQSSQINFTNFSTIRLKLDIMGSRKITWVQRSRGADADFAVHAGIDSGKMVYVARASHLGGVIPGKLHMGHSSVYIPFAQVEVPKSEYEVMTAPPGSLSWVDASGSDIPPHAIKGGRDPNGDDYYIGRVFHEGTITVGKVQRSHGTCYIPHGGKEHGYKNYEVLVRNAYGRALNV